MKRTEGGFTIMELMVTALVVALLAALLFPVFQNAIAESKKTRSMSNMRQIYVSLSMYDNGQRLESPFILPYLADLDLPREIMRTGGYPRLPEDVKSDVYRVMFPHSADEAAKPEWVSHLRVTQDNPVLIVDDTFDRKTDIEELFQPRFAMGLYADGHVKRKREVGNPGSYQFWE